MYPICACMDALIIYVTVCWFIIIIDTTSVAFCASISLCREKICAAEVQSKADFRQILYT